MRNNSQRAEFTIAFLKVVNLENGKDVYLTWGKGPTHRTRLVRVQNHEADFTTEYVRQERVISRDKKLTVHWKPSILRIKLMCVNGKKDVTLATMAVDLTRFINIGAAEVQRPFDLWKTSKYVQRGILAPELFYTIRTQWNDLQNGGLQEPRNDDRQKVTVLEPDMPRESERLRRAEM